MIACQDLGIAAFAHIKEQIVLQEVQQHPRREYRLKGSIIVSHLASRLLPFHIAILLGCDGTYLGECHITHHVEGIVDEERGDELLIVPQLQIGFAGIRLFPTRRFQLDNHQRQTIHEYHDVWAFGIVFLHGELVHY